MHTQLTGVLILEYCPSSIALFEYCPSMTPFLGAILEKLNIVILLEYYPGGGNTRKILTPYFHRVFPQGQYSKKFNSLFSSSIAPWAILEII